MTPFLAMHRSLPLYETLRCILYLENFINFFKKLGVFFWNNLSGQLGCPLPPAASRTAPPRGACGGHRGQSLHKAKGVVLPRGIGGFILLWSRICLKLVFPSAPRSSGGICPHHPSTLLVAPQPQRSSSETLTPSFLMLSCPAFNPLAISLPALEVQTRFMDRHERIPAPSYSPIVGTHPTTPHKFHCFIFLLF